VADGSTWVPHNPYTICRRCGEEIVGQAEAHCSACHQTFANTTCFDAHQPGAADTAEEWIGVMCCDPKEVGMIQVQRRKESNGEWRMVWAVP